MEQESVAIDRRIMILGGVLGFTAVLLGAFGAHGLKETLDPPALASFETGVRYQVYHAFLLLILGSAIKLSRKQKTILFYLLFSGVFLFSGSIYLLTTKALTGIDFSYIYC